MALSGFWPLSIIISSRVWAWVFNANNEQHKVPQGKSNFLLIRFIVLLKEFMSASWFMGVLILWDKYNKNDIQSNISC
jgi:hypothetical protein